MSFRPRTYRAEREFGLLVGGILAALGLWWFYRGRFDQTRIWFVAVGSVLVLLGAAWPRALALPYRAWMGLAEVLSKIVTTVILSAVFFLLVTPIGFLKRLTGWDPLGRRAKPRDSYWEPYSTRQSDPKHFDRMY